jgi:hypothetical protein
LTTPFRRFLVMAPLAVMASGATLAPRVEILNLLVCDQLKPDYTAGRGMEDFGIRPWDISSAISGNGTNPPPYTELCKSDPVVQAGAATIQAGTLVGDRCIVWCLIDQR